MRSLIAALGLALSLTVAAGASAAERMTVLLDWFVNPDHGPLFVAAELGYFAEAGLEVELIAPADPNDPPKFVAAGLAEVAISYQPQLYMQSAAGLGLARIGTLVDNPLNSLVVLADGPIESIADLEGRKVGYSVGGMEEAMLGAMLARHGLTLDDVTLVNVNFSLSPALMSGQVDAVIGAFRNFELNQMDLDGHPGRAFFVEDEGVPAYDELILLARRTALDDPRLPRFLAALERAIAFMTADPDWAWTLFIEGRPELDNELNRRAWRDTLPYFAKHPGALDRARYERFARFMKDNGLIDEIAPLDTYAVELIPRSTDNDP